MQSNIPVPLDAMNFLASFFLVNHKLTKLSHKSKGIKFIV